MMKNSFYFLVFIIFIFVQIQCKAKSEAEFNSQKKCVSGSCEDGYTCVSSRCFKNCTIQSDCFGKMICGEQGFCIVDPKTRNSTITDEDPINVVVKYEVSPEKKEVLIENRKSLSVQFVLYEVRGDQKSVSSEVSWKVEPKGKISVEKDGWIYLDGSVAGVFTLTAFAPDAKGTAQLTVKTSEVVLSDGINIESAQMFSVDNPHTSTTTKYAGSIDSVYPNHEVIVPRNISPILFQWNAVDRVTLYKLTIGGSVSVTSFLTRSTEARFSKEAWSVLADSERNIPLVWIVEGVVESQQNTLYASNKKNITFSDDHLQGAIYYWSVDTANIMRFRMGEDSPKPLFDKTGYPEISQAVKDNVTCAGCHTIASDGKTMALTFEGGSYEGRKGGIIDVQKPYQASIKPEDNKFLSIYQSFSPDVKYLVFSEYNLSLTNILEVSSGNIVKTLVNGPSAHPRWSPDGKMIVFAQVLDSKGLNYEKSEIHALEVNGLDIISDQTIIPADGSAFSDLDISPDSQTMIYRKSFQNSIGDSNTRAFLYSFESKTNIELFKMLDGSNNRDYWYSFSPFPENDYYWVVFFSRRKYGNKTSDGTSQLWIAAMNKDLSQGVDPSHPAFWLNGQDTGTRNMKGQWVPDYCLTEGEKCQQDGAGKICCEGLECKLEGISDTADQQTTFTCQYPSPPCVDKGNPCESGGSIACCNGFLCKISEGSMDKPLCVPPPPPCLEKDEICTLDGVSKCCEPHTCQATQMSDTDLYNIERKCM